MSPRNQLLLLVAVLTAVAILMLPMTLIVISYRNQAHGEILMIIPQSKPEKPFGVV